MWSEGRPGQPLLSRNKLSDLLIEVCERVAAGDAAVQPSETCLWASGSRKELIARQAF